MRFYEVVVITSPDVTADGHKEFLEKVDGILKKKKKKAEKGEILRADEWGIRKLGAPIKKQAKGRYTLLTLQCPPDVLSELERNLRLDDNVLRYQSVYLKKEPTFEEAKAVVTEEAAQAPVEAAGGETTAAQQ